MKPQERSMLQVMNETIREEMARDDKVIYMGECVVGSAMGMTTGLYQQFGPNRVIETGLVENTMVAAGIGLAQQGYRPIIDPMMADFLTPAYAAMTLAGKNRFMHGGKIDLPMVILTTMGGYLGLGAEHSGCPESQVMHIPGIKLVVPSSIVDARGLLKTAIRDNNPVCYYFHKRLMREKGPVTMDEDGAIPFGVADIKRAGTDVTVVATGYMVSLCQNVAAKLAEKGISVEIVDPRTLVPLDIETIIQSVKKTSRAVVVDEDYITCGVGGEIAMQIMERAFDYLDGPVKRIGAKGWVPATGVEKYVLPQPQEIADAITSLVRADRVVVDAGIGKMSLYKTD
ncbi:MAG TPA: transketolase C-terminal domain-containing protein [Phenylobacterium sp.]|uniref:alpha-ketoacid dehydrogenase subunit beta n=1 Tax=Phenylobacterium sp. TaxID=1871053 RepID=UPI002B47020F|nr:transketolase C-terminal domain-containing protein [Phenylobacterium sp.]HKQ94917.1 transketolase C-terminal domain-containing protein [Aestuariivirgaceae bacterium]HKR90260.1 transketolase C-terminal domain-containing protein [Phenylobacterium sp.]